MYTHAREPIHSYVTHIFIMECTHMRRINESIRIAVFSTLNHLWTVQTHSKHTHMKKRKTVWKIQYTHKYTLSRSLFISIALLFGHSVIQTLKRIHLHTLSQTSTLTYTYFTCDLNPEVSVLCMWIMFSFDCARANQSRTIEKQWKEKHKILFSLFLKTSFDTHKYT